MAGQRITQSSFLAGELTPLAHMRRDKPFYEHGSAKLRNMTIRVQGACETRPGSVFRDVIEGPTLEFDWVFNPDQSYLLVLTAGRLRVYNNETAVKVFDTTSGATWDETHFERMTFTQQLDTLIVCHPDLPTIKILRTGASTFTIGGITFDSNTTSPANRILQPHYKFALPAVTLAASATSGSVTLTASAALFVSGHVGTRFRLVAKEVEITAVTDSTHATATVKETLTATTATADWSEQVFSAVRGWPHTAQFFGSRLVFGGARERPLGWWASQIGKYWNFDLGTSQDNEAIWEEIGQADVSEIRHLVVDRHLLVFCDGAVFQVTNSETTALTPKNFKIPPQTTIGASYLRPRNFDGGVIYTQNESNLVRILRYNDVDQKYVPETANMLAPHLVDSPKRMARTFAVAPRQENVSLWANADGTIGAYHANTENQVSAWTLWTLGGGMLCKSVAAVREKFWCVATLGDDYFLLLFDWTAPPLDASVSQTSATATRAWGGLTQHVGYSVDGWSNGYSIGSAIVDDLGAVTLPDTSPATLSASFGFAFRQHVQPLPINMPNNAGSSHGRVMGLIRYYVDVVTSGVFSIDGAFPDTEMSYDVTEPAPEFSGITGAFHLGYDESAQFDLIIDQPQRITLRGITREVKIGG